MKTLFLALAFALGPLWAYAQVPAGIYNKFENKMVTNIRKAQGSFGGCLQFDLVGVANALSQGSPVQTFSIPTMNVAPNQQSATPNPDYPALAQALLGPYREGKAVTVMTGNNPYRDDCGAALVIIVHDARMVE